MPIARRAKCFKSPGAFRVWLDNHHATAQELWVGFHKKSTGKPSITWPESVDEALCFGWIDLQTYLPTTSLDSKPTRGPGPSTKLSLPGTAALRRGGSSALNRKEQGSGVSPLSSSVQRGVNPFPRSRESPRSNDHSEVRLTTRWSPSRVLRDRPGRPEVTDGAMLAWAARADISRPLGVRRPPERRSGVLPVEDEARPKRTSPCGEGSLCVPTLVFSTRGPHGAWRC